jgi:hypothetical protein
MSTSSKKKKRKDFFLRFREIGEKKENEEVKLHFIL